jgi:predicted kinase
VIIFEGAVCPVGYPGRDNVLVATRGLPGCGKSTALQGWRALAPDHRVVLGRDDWRSTWGCLPVGSEAQEAAITVAMDGAVDALLRAGWDVGVDSTHIQPGTLEHWQEVAGRLGVRWEVVDLACVPVEVCVARDEARAAAGGRHVGAEVIREMARLYLPEAATIG